MSESKNFNPLRLERIPPALIWKSVNTEQGVPFVDICAGTGFITREIADTAGPSVHIHALDIERLMIEEMEQSLPPAGAIKPQLMERDRLPFDGDSVDGVWMITLYHELEAPLPLLREIMRVLRPSGKLLIIDWEKNDKACKQGPHLEHRVAM